MTQYVQDGSDGISVRSSTWRTKQNWYIHQCYIRQEYEECLATIEERLAGCSLCEYATHVKALILRQRGKIQESLTLFQWATCINPQNPANIVQVGHSLYLLGKHKQAIDVYDEARRIGEKKQGMANFSNWEIWHNKGLCFIYLKQLPAAIDCFFRANAAERHDATYLQLGRAYQMQENYDDAIKVYKDALEFSPENPELLTTIGLIWLRLQDNARAFENLGNALTHDPRSTKTILAAGSIIQDNQEMDTAINKYRIAVVQTPNSSQLWNNIGMCFFGKAQYVAAISCLKHALYLDPFEWIICYNLGLVHLNTGQHASAFHFLSASINLKSDFPASYMYLAVTLARLNDYANACTAYEKAISMEEDHMNHLNFAITLFNHGDIEKAREQLKIFQDLFQALDEQDVEHDWEVIAQHQALEAALKEHA